MSNNTKPLVFATNNLHKLEEIRQAVGNSLPIIGLKEAGIDIEIPEPFDTLELNALEKARTIIELTGLTCFSEDTGLEVKALHGAPGVKSARYAGEHAGAEENVTKLLLEMSDIDDRQAQFRTIICLIMDDEIHYFEGICKGTIINELKGSFGFGYDPVFIPAGSDRTFAEMNAEEKNRFSHRKKAADRLVAFLQHRMNFIDNTKTAEL